MSIEKQFALRIKRLIEVAGSQRALGRLLDVSSPTIMGWLAGSMPYDSTFQKMSEKTGVSVDWLRFGDGDEDREMVNFRRAVGHQISGARSKLKIARDRAGYTQAQFAKKIGYQIGVLQSIEDGSGRASEKMIDAILKVLPTLEKSDLAEGSDSPRTFSELGTSATFGSKPNIRLPEGVRARYVPHLSWAQAGALDAGFVDDAYDYTGILSIDVNDARAFGVEIRGNSMEPRIAEGDNAIVCPTWTPRAGDTVICRTVHGDVMCKIYQPKKGGEIVVLSSYNPAYPPMELKREEIAWIYPVGQITQSLRKE